MKELFSTQTFLAPSLYHGPARGRLARFGICDRFRWCGEEPGATERRNIQSGLEGRTPVHGREACPTLVVETEGPDEQEAMAAVTRLIANCFEENE